MFTQETVLWRTVQWTKKQVALWPAGQETLSGGFRKSMFCHVYNMYKWKIIIILCVFRSLKPGGNYIYRHVIIKILYFIHTMYAASKTRVSKPRPAILFLSYVCTVNITRQFRPLAIPLVLLLPHAARQPTQMSASLCHKNGGRLWYVAMAVETSLVSTSTGLVSWTSLRSVT